MKVTKTLNAEDLCALAKRDIDGAFAHLNSAVSYMQQLVAMTLPKKDKQERPKPENTDKAQPKPKRRRPKKVQTAVDTIPTVTTEQEHPVRRRTPASVRLTPHEVTLNVGSHPVKALADNDAKDFIGNPRVFWYRAMQFPDPRRYQVQPHVENVRVVKRADKRFENAPWTCSVTVTLVGDTKRCENWGLAFYTKNKGEQE